jgi:hypothetical protein
MTAARAPSHCGAAHAARLNVYLFEGEAEKR